MDGGGFNSYKNKFNTSHDFPKDESHTLDEISKLTGYSKKGLQTIYNKGIGAYHTNPSSVRPQVKSPEQWAMARVYAAINPTSGAYKVDKSHLIKGGMAVKNFDTGEIMLGNTPELDTEDNPDINLTNEREFQKMDEYVDIISDENTPQDKKEEYINKLAKYISMEIEDLQDFQSDPNISEERREEIKQLSSLLLSYVDLIPKWTDQNKVIKKMDIYNEALADLVLEKNLHAKMQDEANIDVNAGINAGIIPLNEAVKYKNTIRGEKLEDFLDTPDGKKYLKTLDGDNSTQYNTKNINGYSQEFKNILDNVYMDYVNYCNDNNIPPEAKNAYLQNILLQFVPIDLIKNKTLWEIKSEKDLPVQRYSKTKIIGFERDSDNDGLYNPINSLSYEILFKPYDGKKRKVDNIIFNASLNGQIVSVPILKPRANGYNYLTLFNNDTKTSVYNVETDPDLVDKKLSQQSLSDMKQRLKDLHLINEYDEVIPFTDNLKEEIYKDIRNRFISNMRVDDLITVNERNDMINNKTLFMKKLRELGLKKSFEEILRNIQTDYNFIKNLSPDSSKRAKLKKHRENQYDKYDIPSNLKMRVPWSFEKRYSKK
jgi:hypothetical protein